MKKAFGAVGLLGLGLLELASCSGFGSAPGETPGPDGGGIDGESLTPVQLAIESVSMDPKVVAPQARDTVVTVRIKRAGFLEPVEVSFPNLPKGITSEKVFVERGKDTATMVLRVAKDVPLGTAANLRVFANGGATKVAEASLEIVGAPGALDLSFGGAGQVVETRPIQEIVDAGLTSDDRLIVLGRDSSGVFLRRYQPDGAVDETYGQGGLARPFQSINGLPQTYFKAYALAVAPDGNAFMANVFIANGTPGISRISPDGKTFVDADTVLTKFSNVNSLVRLANGSLVASGMRDVAEAYSPTSGGGLIFAVHGPSVNLDRSWGNDVTNNVKAWVPRPGYAEASAVTVAVAGEAFDVIETPRGLWGFGDAPNPSGKFVALVKLTSTGKFERSYQAGGVGSWELGANYLGAVPVTGDDFVVAGARRSAFVLRRFLGGDADPKLDLQSLTVSGLSDGTNESRHRMIRDGSGFLLAGGGESIFLVRATKDLVPDTDFGQAGISAIPSGGPNLQIRVSRVLQQRSGRVVVVGSLFDSNTGTLVASLSRHWPARNR